MFRVEVEAARADRLTGEVIVTLPRAWQWVGVILLGTVAAALLFLSFASYARVETATGTIVPEAGVVSVMSNRPGVIANLPVRDGQMVLAGTVLASIRADIDSSAGPSFDEQVRRAIIRQDQSLAAQSLAGSAANEARKGELREQRTGLLNEIGQIRTQIAIQSTLVAAAKEDLERAAQVAQRGFISRRDIAEREETVAQREQALSQLRQSLGSRQASLAQSERTMAQLDAETSGQASAIAAARAAVAQQAASTAGAQAFALRAPLAGRVSAITARAGQTVTPGVSLMTIIPLRSKLYAELDVPTSAIGFVKKGQAVNLAIDTFPFQRFGTVRAQVLTVAANAVPRQVGKGSTEPVYPVAVALERQYIRAFGRDEPLLPGMTLTARIVTEKQTLLRWLFEPLFAVRDR
jgi:membrane fusion protein